MTTESTVLASPQLYYFVRFVRLASVPEQTIVSNIIRRLGELVLSC